MAKAKQVWSLELAEVIDAVIAKACALGATQTGGASVRFISDPEDNEVKIAGAVVEFHQSTKGPGRIVGNAVTS